MSLQLALYHIVDMNEKAQVCAESAKKNTHLEIWLIFGGQIIWLIFLGTNYMVDFFGTIYMVDSNQTLTTNCEVITKWNDVFLVWDPEE